MKLFHQFLKHFRGINAYVFKTFSSKSASKSLSKYVFISENTDIFVNLALEDWLYHNWDFSSKQILLLWRNTEAVVIGRHQNPWLEANIKNGPNCIPIVRRNSGGGAVYHDLYNLNLSFMSSKETHNRVHNLEIIKRSLQKEWDIECQINSRSDIVYQSKKISGTASKLSRTSAYHHCTLLVDVNKNVLTSSLHSEKMNITTNATVSKPSPTLNLRELNTSINIERLMSVIGIEFLNTTQNKEKIEAMGFHSIVSEEKYFPGINKKLEQFRSWDWIYGRTPKFTVSDSFGIINFQIFIESGLIKGIHFDAPSVSVETISRIKTALVEQKFSTNTIDNLKKLLSNLFNKEIKAYN